ncbi:MAG TPA: hypothetical protein VF886_06845, partial [Roseiarcus sp.]
NTELASGESYDFRRDFDRIARPGLCRYLDVSAAVLGDAFNDERRAGYVKGYARDLWRGHCQTKFYTLVWAPGHDRD